MRQLCHLALVGAILACAGGGRARSDTPPPAVQPSPEEVFQWGHKRILALEAKHELLRGISEVKPVTERDEKGQLTSVRLGFQRNAESSGKGVVAVDESRPWVSVDFSVWRWSPGPFLQIPADLQTFKWKGQTYAMRLWVFSSDAELAEAARKLRMECPLHGGPPPLPAPKKPG